LALPEDSSTRALKVGHDLVDAQSAFAMKNGAFAPQTLEPPPGGTP